MNFKINRIQHIGIPVADLSISEVFYQKLGFENVMSSTFEHGGGQGKVAMMQSGEVIVEIYQMPDLFLTEIKSRKDGRIDHIAFDVDDIDFVYDSLKNEGFIILEPEPVFLPFWKNGCKYFNISGPNGERIEFNQIL
ncbi:hypothetical protein EMA8858_01290 [Emticicia aquatica]|jgi:lactoylglutathione lyase|uniref:VOC domain-containing protein n=1 Tax=Emticicia aquatica TaxID=1681835 RepID=A0ABM9AN06_9BACT|nr:VOC family protein [Emticicia aquatica]CAH0995170.1 hypothetical protein EMA8858_01290 [Emticicia aquatica]